MNKINIDDSELMSLLYEDEENIKNIIYDKYSYIVNNLIKKYKNVIKMFRIDIEEFKSEGYLGLSDGINSFRDNKDASLKTFLTLCTERRITNFLNKNTSKKARFINEVLSLDYSYNDGELKLEDIISDQNKNNPEKNMEMMETIEEILNTAKEKLSNFEYEVFTYMLNNINYTDIATILEKSPKQIDNTIQRIKKKLKEIL